MVAEPGAAGKTKGVMYIHVIVGAEAVALEGADRHRVAMLHRGGVRGQIGQRRRRIGHRPVAMRHRIERKIPFVFVDIQVGEPIGLAKRASHAGERTVHARLAVAFQDDIDDPMIALGVIFGGGIGHNLDALDLVGRDLVQRQLGLFAVEENGRRSVAKGNIAGGVDIQRGYLAKRVLRGAALAGEALIHIEHFLVHLRAEYRPARHYGDGLHLRGGGRQPDGSDDKGDSGRAMTGGDDPCDSLVADDADLQNGGRLGQAF